MPRYDLDGKVAIVTGSGRGIGRAIAHRLAREGVSVLVTDVESSSARTVTEEITGMSGRASALRVDVTNLTDVTQMVAEAVTRFGRLDILVNNAGIAVIQPLLDTPEKSWDAVMNVNAKGTFLCSQAAARQMIRQGGGGRIINNASGAGKIAPGRDTPIGAYAASKHAVLGLSKQLAMELSVHGILVNCVCAGIVQTEMWDQIDREVARIQGRPVGSIKAQAVSGIPLGRIQQPEDIANMVAFLASSDGSYITGQALNVCGGLLPY